MQVLTVRYDPALVLLSLVVALAGSVTGLAVSTRIRPMSGPLRPRWLLAAGFALGTGIWGMHFTTMLALRLPVVVAYRVDLMLASQLIADLAALAALFFTFSTPFTRRDGVVAAIAIGASIAGLHYVAMAAMQMPAQPRYHAGLVAVSVVVAVALGFLALVLGRRFHDDLDQRRWPRVALATAVMAAAIVGTHYLGFAATRYEPAAPRVVRGTLVASGGLPVLVLGSTLAILTVALAATAVDRSRYARAALDQRLLDSREHERRRIARVLHEDVGQNLTAIRLDLQRLERADDATRRAIVADTTALVDVVLEGIRDLSLALRPSVLDDLGLVPAVRWLVQRSAERAGYQGRVDDRLEGTTVPDSSATAAFDIVREGLTNIARHAEASHVAVDLARADARLALSIRDDGVGFDVTAAQRRAESGGSLGVLGMRETAARAGGALVISSAPGEGTTVMAILPLEAAT